MASTERTESGAMSRARAELRAIVSELRAIKSRVRATAARLRAAESTATAVDLHPDDGEPYTVERWAASLLTDGVGEALDTVLLEVAHVADVEKLRAEIRTYLEDERQDNAPRAPQGPGAGDRAN